MHVCVSRCVCLTQGASHLCSRPSATSLRSACRETLELWPASWRPLALVVDVLVDLALHVRVCV